MNVAVYFRVQLLLTVSSLIDGRGRLDGFETQGDAELGPTGMDVIKTTAFAGTSQLHGQKTTKNYLVHAFKWNRGKLMRRTPSSPTSEILSVSAPEELAIPQDASGESHGPQTVDVASHLLADYGVMGVSEEEDSAKWAAEQMKNRTKDSKEVNGSLVDAVESKVLRNQSVNRNQSGVVKLQASYSSSEIQAANNGNTSDNHQQITKQKGNLLENSTLTLERELDTPRQANQSLNQNQTNIAELKANRTDTEGSGDADFVTDISALRSNQSFYLKLPNGASITNVRNSNVKFSPNEEQEDITQSETSGLLENTEAEDDGSSLDNNITSVGKWNGSDSKTEEHLESANATNTIVTSSGDLRSNPAESQPSISYAVASDELNLQGQSRELQNPTGGEKAKLEDDENLAKALSDSSVSSIVFSDKRLNADNYLLGGEGQKKSTLQGKQISMKRHQKGERNAVRRYLKAKTFSTNRHTFESRSHVLAKKDEVSSDHPPELIGASKNDSRSNTQPTIGNGVMQSSRNILLQSTKSNNTAHILAKDRPDNYGAKDNQSKQALFVADTTHRVENHQDPDPALHSTSNNLKKNESNILLSTGPSQSPHKYNHEFLNNAGISAGNQHEKVTTDVLIQDDSGRPVYQGAVDIFKARNNVSSGTKELQENQVFPNNAFKPSEKDQSTPETSLPEVYTVTEQNQITSKSPADAKLHQSVVSHPPEDVPSVSISSSLTGNQDSRNYSRFPQQDVTDMLVRNSSTHEKQPRQDMENKLQEQDKHLSVGETPELRPLSEEQQQNDGPWENPKELKYSDPRQQTYLQSLLQRQQDDNLPQNMQHGIKHPDSGEAQIQEPTYEDDNLKEEVFHIVLHNGNKMITDPYEHMTLTISGPLPETGVEIPVNSDASNFQSDHNAKQLHQMVSENNGFPGNSDNNGLQKTSKSAEDNYPDGHVQSNREKVTEEDRQKVLNQPTLDESGNSIKGRPSENNPNNDLSKQGVEQPIGESHEEQKNQDVMRDSSLNKTAQKVGQVTSDTKGLDYKPFSGNQNSSKFMAKGFIGPVDANTPHQGAEMAGQKSTLLDQADERLNSNIFVKATNRATASLSSMNGFASNDEIAAMEGPTVTGDVPPANPESHKMDCHVSPQSVRKSSLTILTCRKKKFISNTPQAFKGGMASNLYNPQTDQSLTPFSMKAQGGVPRLDEVLNVLNQDTKVALNKEMSTEGKNIQNMLQGFANPSRVSMYGSSEVGTPFFDWLPETHKRNSGEGFSRPPWRRMNMKGNSLWDPVHQIMLPHVRLTNYWRHLRRQHHRLHRAHPRRPLFPWSRPLHGSESGVWSLHLPADSFEYGHFIPSLSPRLVWSHHGNSALSGARRRKLQTFRQENASRRTSLFNNILKGDRDNCRPRAEGLHSHMGEWEYLGRVLCSCPFAVGEW